jgi:predicted molibdopterin-dependent oxidoreductase YjgC
MNFNGQHSIQAPQLTRLKETSRDPVAFMLDGRSVQALNGDTVLTAILTHQAHLRLTDSSLKPRAGFCLMGACQDCWITLETGERLRACTTIIEAGMRIVTSQSTAE